MAGCSTGNKLYPLHISGWDITKNSKYTLKFVSPKVVSVIIGSSYHADIEYVQMLFFTDKFVFDKLFDYIKRGVSCYY